MGEKPWERSCYECQSVESTYPCPLKNCTKHSLKEEIKWTHSNCGGYLRLYDNGKEKCQKCGYEDLFCFWNYNCDTDNKNTNFSTFKMRAILQYLVAVNDAKVSEDFWLNIKACFKKQKKDYPNKFE